MADTASWNAEPPRPRAPRIPELGLEPEPAPRKPEFAPTTSFPEDDEEFVDGGFGDEFEDEFEDRPAGSVAAIEAPPKQAERGKPDKKSRKQAEAAAPAPVAPPAATEARPKAKPPKDGEDDDFDDDDDDDDFDDDDEDDFDVDEDDSRGSMAGEILTSGASTAAAQVQPRKLPWIPIALVASVLVMVSAYVFRDALFGSDEATDEAGAGEVAETEPQPEPEPPPPEPEPKVEPKPEPPPPAIPAEELEAKLAEATDLLDRQKHADATVVIDEILGKLPKEPRALALRAMTQLEKQKYEEALVTANECVEIDATQAACWIAIATIEQLNKNLPRALEGYRKYLEFEPEGRFAKGAKREVERLSAKVEG